MGSPIHSEVWVQTTMLTFSGWIRRTHLLLLAKYFLAFFSVVSHGVWSAESSVKLDPIFSLSLEELTEVKIITLTRQPENLSRSFASTYVISSSELTQLGARTIYDALQHIPGINKGVGQFGEHTLALRGVRSSYSEKILILMDSHVINDVRSGSASYQYLDKMAIENIDRIEVVLGTGSSVYGSNAFLGMVNIITKEGAETSNNIDIHSSLEFDQHSSIANSVNVFYSDSFENGYRVALNVLARDDKGVRLEVDRDVFGQSGLAATEQAIQEVYFKLNHTFLSIKGRFYTRDSGDYYGLFNVLNDHSKQSAKYGFLDVSYKADLSPDTRMEFAAYYDHQKTDNNYEAIPAGIIPPSSGFYPWNDTGFLARTMAQESIYGSDVRFRHDALEGHVISAGFSYRNERLHDTGVIANYDPLPLAEVTNISKTNNWILPAEREIFSVYGQDLWALTDELSLSLDGRYDDYSDFGSSFNPRLGASWQVNERYRMRINVGRAFRAPDFLSMYLTNSPSVIGNENLVAEEIDSREIGLTYQPFKQILMEATVYNNNLTNLIGVGNTSFQYQNNEKVKVHGIDIGYRHQLNKRLLLNVNYSRLKYHFGSLYNHPMVPKESASAIFDWSILDSVHWNINAYWQSISPRASTDIREDLPEYVVLNTTWNMQLDGHLSAHFSVMNLMDKDYSYPASANTYEDDYPAPARSFFTGFNYKIY